MVRSKCDTSFLNKKINENNQCADGRKKRRKTRIDTQRLLSRPETESVRRKVTRSSLRLLTRAQGNSKGSFRTGVDKGGSGGPGPPNGRAKFFLVKIDRLSSLPPAKSGRACYDNPTGRGYFYQMPNVYTCIAYLIEIRKFCSKNEVYKGANFEAQNALKLTYEHL